MQVIPPSVLLKSFRRTIAQEAQAAESLLVELLAGASDKACKNMVSGGQQIGNMSCNRHMRADWLGKIQKKSVMMRLT